MITLNLFILLLTTATLCDGRSTNTYDPSLNFNSPYGKYVENYNGLKRYVSKEISSYQNKWGTQSQTQQIPQRPKRSSDANKKKNDNMSNSNPHKNLVPLDLRTQMFDPPKNSTIDDILGSLSGNDFSYMDRK